MSSRGRLKNHVPFGYPKYEYTGMSIFGPRRHHNHDNLPYIHGSPLPAPASARDADLGEESRKAKTKQNDAFYQAVESANAV